MRKHIGNFFKNGHLFLSMKIGGIFCKTNAPNEPCLTPNLMHLKIFPHAANMEVPSTSWRIMTEVHNKSLHGQADLSGDSRQNINVQAHSSVLSSVCNRYLGL